MLDLAVRGEEFVTSGLFSCLFPKVHVGVFDSLRLVEASPLVGGAIETTLDIVWSRSGLEV